MLYFLPRSRFNLILLCTKGFTQEKKKGYKNVQLGYTNNSHLETATQCHIFNQQSQKSPTRKQQEAYLQVYERPDGSSIHIASAHLATARQGKKAGPLEVWEPAEEGLVRHVRVGHQLTSQIVGPPQLPRRRSEQRPTVLSHPPPTVQ